MKVALLTGYVLLMNLIGSQTVVCSFEVLQDLCSQLCEDTAIEVTSIVPKNSDPHLFQPKPSDSKKISKARLVIVNGLGLEGWIGGIIKASDYNGEIVEASATIKPRMLGKIPDPHIWHDPVLVVVMVRNMKDALSKKFPDKASIIERNAARVTKDSLNLNERIRAIFAKLPEARKAMLTTHDAFSYFANRYHIKVYSPQGVSTGDDPSAAEISKLVTLIRKSGIRAIFLEQLANPKIIQVIANETGKELSGVLYADTLAPGKNLQDTILINAENIAKAMDEE